MEKKKRFVFFWEMLPLKPSEVERVRGHSGLPPHNAPYSSSRRRLFPAVRGVRLPTLTRQASRFGRHYEQLARHRVETDARYDPRSPRIEEKEEIECPCGKIFPNDNLRST